MRSRAGCPEAQRLGVVRAALLLLLLAIAARAAHLSVAYERSRGVRDGQVQTTLRLAPERGEIVDRNGRKLAVTVRSPSVYAIPAELGDRSATARRLAAAFSISEGELQQRLDGRRQFTFLSRWVPRERARKVEALELPGVGVVDEPRRAYPNGALAAAVIGFANIDGHGVRGIEQQEDGWLRGQAWRVGVERDGSGRNLLRPGVDARAAAGGDVALTLDVKLQADAERALREAVERTGAKRGSVLALDPRSGEILSLAEWPGFDPNQFRRLDFRSTRLRAFTDASEPGSTFKIFTLAAALDSDAIGAREPLETAGGELRVPGKTVRDARDFGALDAAGVLRHSSNVGAVLIAQALGAQRHYEALRRFGFGDSLGTGFPAESTGLLRHHARWRPVDHATVSFGQGLSVTTVQLGAAVAALANGGEWVRPRLVAARRRVGGRWQRTAPEPARRVVRRETAERVLAMMESVVSREGTGRRAALAGLRVAGKTGTAQKLDPETGRYSHELYRAWFVGAVPAEAPRLVVVATLDEPEPLQHTGGVAAAPLFAEVAASHLASLGIVTHPAPLPPAPATPREPRMEQRIEQQIEQRTAAASPGNPAEQVAVQLRERAARRRDAASVEVVREELAGNEIRGASRDARVTSPESMAVASPGASQAATSDAVSVEVVRLAGKLLVPDFRGLSLSEVMRITSREALDLQVRGEGWAVEQRPGPGTILTGAHPTVWIRFAPARSPWPEGPPGHTGRTGEG